jgi:2-polyprenyl-3-methyl-5-hydroxy-6-metoxy-1,4-benzoquinol methylase
MYVVDRSVRFMRGFLASYAPTSVKKLFWDREFSSGDWDFLDNTADDCVYQHLEKYARKGSILDLGCGPGNTANEVASDAYHTYVGLDISEAALEKARRRTEANGRSEKNFFVQGDFLTYTPTQSFDVILFRESLYHVPMGKIKPVLDRFANFVRDDGVLMVRLNTIDNGKRKHRPTAMLGIVEREFNVIERTEYAKGGATVVVFRPKAHKPAEAIPGVVASLGT